MNNWQTTPGVMRLKEEDTVPFMAKKEYEYIRDLINRERFETALEWGAGSSTIWFPKNCDIKSWLAVEHDLSYFQFIQPKVDPKVNMIFLPEHDDYINIAGKYDFILIDGLYRDECLAKAFEMLSDHPHSQIILHDAGRKAYHDFYDKYPHKIIFEGENWLGDGYDHRGLAVFGNYE